MCYTQRCMFHPRWVNSWVYMTAYSHAQSPKVAPPGPEMSVSAPFYIPTDFSAASGVS